MEQKTPHDQHHNKKSLIEKADTANQESLRHSREVPNVTTQVQNILAPSSTSHLMTNLFPTSTDQQTLLSWFSSTTYPIPIYSSFEGIGFNYNNNNNNNNNIDMINHNNELEVSKGSSMRKSASQGFQGTSTTGLTFDSDSNKPLSFTGSFMDRYNNHSASDNESALNLSGPITASTSPAMKTISGPTPGNSISPASRSYSSVLHSQAPSHSSTQSIPAAPSQHTIQHGMLHPYQSGISTTASQHLNTSVFKSDFLAQGNRQAIQHQQNFKHVNDFLSPLAQRSYNQHLVQNYSAQLSAASPSGTSSLSGISGSATGSPFRRNFFSGSNFPDKSSTLQGNGGPKRRNKLPSIGTSGGVPGDLQRRLDTLANAGAENSERFSRKVFVGGLPPDIDEEEIKASFRRFGSLVVDWPHKAESKSYFPPKGYAFLLFQEEASVQALIEASLQEDDKLYLCVSSPTIKDKPVQIRPWRLSDADFVLDSTLALDPRKTVFVGGVPRPLKASELANIMNNLYGSVCYAGIDTDPELKYPKGAGRVAFSNHQSYIDAISARFVHLRHCEIEKRVEVKPYVLDDQVCDECRGSRCGNKFAPFFCANITCLQYYCENCWTTVHSQLGKEFHKPLVKEGADRPRGSQFKWC